MKNLESRSVFLLLLGYASFSMFWLSLGVALPSIMLEFSINEVQAGLLFFARILPSIVLLTPAGYLADRFGQKRLLLVGYLLICFGVIMLSESQGYLACLSYLVIAGAGGGLVGPTYYSMVGEALKRVRGLAMGLATGFFSFGGLLGSVLVGFFVAQQQWRFAYTIIGASILLMMLVQFFGVRSSQTTKNTGLKTNSLFLKLIRTRNVLVMSASAFIGNAIFYSITAWFPTFLHLSIRLDVASVGLVFGLFMVIGAVGSPLLGAISDRFGRRLIIGITGIASAVISILTFAFATQFPFYLSIGCSLILGFFACSFFPLVVTLAQESVSKEFATYVTGLTLTFALLGGAAGPLAASIFITAFNLNQALIYAITLPAFIYGLLALAAVKNRK